MEILLAMVVISAVIFFGALLSMGNERQRRAIDDLREQVVLWAVQDLKIKREKLARTVQVPDPLGWLNRHASKVCGLELNLQVLEMLEDPSCLVCSSSDHTVKVAFSPHSPAELRRFRNKKHRRLSTFTGQNPLPALSRKGNAHELSVLNGGLLFDLELPLVWKALTGHDLEMATGLWLYEYF